MKKTNLNKTESLPDYYFDRLVHYHKVLKLKFGEAIKQAQADVAKMLKVGK